jgi:CRP-like cAMP-binding protein
MAENKEFIELIGFRKRQIIFREGERGSCMYEVDSGLVGIFIEYGKRGQKKLTEVAPGGFFGEMGMVRGFVRSATAVSLDDQTSVRPISWETLGLYFKEAPAKIVGIMQQMGQRIEKLSEDYLAACGAVQELSTRCGELAEENRKLARKLNRLQPADGTARPEGMPTWRTIAGESAEKQDERFRRYIEDYRNYLERREKQA